MRFFKLVRKGGQWSHCRGSVDVCVGSKQAECAVRTFICNAKRTVIIMEWRGANDVTCCDVISPGLLNFCYRRRTLRCQNVFCNNRFSTKGDCGSVYRVPVITSSFVLNFAGKWPFYRDQQWLMIIGSNCSVCMPFDEIVDWQISSTPQINNRWNTVT